MSVGMPLFAMDMRRVLISGPFNFSLVWIAIGFGALQYLARPLGIDQELLWEAIAARAGSVRSLSVLAWAGAVAAGAVIVAVVGICLTLTTLITERSRELGVLRAIGASVGQLRKLLLWESAMIGLLAAVVGVASGLCLSFVLTGVINRAFFGWTIQLAFPWGSLALTPLWIIAAAILAGVLPAWRAGRVVVAEALRSE